MYKLKVPINVNIAHFVAAIVEAAATRGKSRIGASHHVTESDISSIASKRMSLASEANNFMVRATQTCAELEDYLSELRGDMECGMVDFVLDKIPNEQKDVVSLRSIVEDSIKKATDPSAAEVKSPSVESSTADYVFDPTRDVAQQTLANPGWKVGNLVSLKKLEAEVWWGPVRSRLR